MILILILILYILIWILIDRRILQQSKMDSCRWRVNQGPELKVYYPTDKPSINAFLLRPESISHICRCLKIPCMLFRLLLSHRIGATTTKPSPLMHNKFKLFPVILFSTGIKGTTDMYAHLALQFVQAGYIFMVIEHEAGDTCYSKDAIGNFIQYINPPDNAKNPTDAVQYRDIQLKPNHNAFYKRLTNIKTFRQPFLRKRVQEIRFATTALSQHDVLSTTQSNQTIQDMLNHMDTQHLIIMGHSMGGASVVTAVHEMPPHTYRACILFDPFLFICETTINLYNTPCVLFLSNNWTGNINASFVHRLVYANKVFSACIPGARHLFVGDPPFWFPYWFGVVLGFVGHMDPGVILKAIINQIHVFIQHDKWEHCKNISKDVVWNY